MTRELRNKIIKAAKYVKNGDPLKDVLSKDEIEDAIVFLADIFKKLKD
jgi:hypothetical protein